MDLPDITGKGDVGIGVDLDVNRLAKANVADGGLVDPGGDEDLGQIVGDSELVPAVMKAPSISYCRRMNSAPVASDDLRSVLLDQLDSVQLHVCGQAALVGADETDPGTMDWSAKATISVWLEEEDESSGDGPAWYTVDGISLFVTEDPGGERELTVLEANGLIVDLAEAQDVFDALDARSQDYEHFVPLFGDHCSFGLLELADELEDKLEPGGGQVLIIDRVRLAPAWRGLGGVGRLLIARLLRWVCDEPRIVAVHPFPIDLNMDERQDTAVFRPALDRVRQVWASLAFEPFTDDIWIMDPRRIAHGDAVAALSKRLGL